MGKTSYAQTKWYLIDNHILGKTDGHGCYIFNNGGWEEDSQCLIMNCLMGYDPTEEGPYVLGNIEIMDQIHEISEIEAVAFMNMQ